MASNQNEEKKPSHTAVECFLLFHAAIIIIFGFFFDYEGGPATGEYSEFQDVHIMIFLGFGFLMSFLCHASFIATGHSLLLASFTVLWGLINLAFWHRVIGSKSWNREPLGIDSLVNADFCAGSILIAFGAMLGRLTMSQMLCMATMQVVFYCINEAILVTRFGVADLGGSMVIHTFGAYFGLACSLVLDKKPERKVQLDKEDNQPDATHVSDTMAMVGTIFLWCFWPSFNAYFGGPASAGGLGSRAVVNTYLSLCGSTMMTFYFSKLFNGGKLQMVDVQNATLAGGVAIGAAGPMLVGPYGALIIGSAAGILSVIGYNRLTPFLQDKIGLRDTCGIHNLHGMPGVLGAIASIIMSGEAHDVDRYERAGTPASSIWVFITKKNIDWRSLIGYQIASLFVTLAIAILTGALTGAVLRLFPTIRRFYNDHPEYVVHVEAHDDEENEVNRPTIAATTPQHREQHEQEMAHYGNPQQQQQRGDADQYWPQQQQQQQQHYQSQNENSLPRRKSVQSPTMRPSPLDQNPSHYPYEDPRLRQGQYR